MRTTTTSAATFLGSIGDAAVVYKPLVPEVLGWNVVTRTCVRDGPFGEGMV